MMLRNEFLIRFLLESRKTKCRNLWRFLSLGKKQGLVRWLNWTRSKS
jgi:hypothetical protein